MADIKKYQGGSASTLNQLNISVILDRIRSGVSISRSSLAKSLQLSTFKTKIVLSSLGVKSNSLGAVRSAIKHLDKKILSPLFL